MRKTGFFGKSWRVLLCAVLMAVMFMCTALGEENSAVWFENSGNDASAKEVSSAVLAAREDNREQTDKITCPERIEVEMGKPMALNDVFAVGKDENGNAYELEADIADTKILKLEKKDSGFFFVPVKPGVTKITAKIKGDDASAVTVEAKVDYRYELNMQELVFVPCGTKGYRIEIKDYEPADAPKPVCTWSIGTQSVAADWIQLGFDKVPSEASITVTPPIGDSVTIQFVIFDKIDEVRLAVSVKYVKELMDNPPIPLIVGHKIETVACVTVDGRTFENPEGSYKVESLNPDIMQLKNNNDLYMIDDGEATVKVTFNGYGKSKSAERKFEVLPTLVLPEGIKKIGDSAFGAYSQEDESEEAFLEKVEAVYIPDGCTAIGSEAFSGCRNLKLIRIPDTVTDIEFDAFDGCPLKTDKENGFVIIAKKGSEAEVFARDNTGHPKYAFIYE